MNITNNRLITARPDTAHPADMISIVGLILPEDRKKDRRIIATAARNNNKLITNWRIIRDTTGMVPKFQPVSRPSSHASIRSKGPYIVL